MAARYKTTIETPHRPRTCLRASVERTGRKPLTAIFGGIPLKRQRKAVLIDRRPSADIVIRRTELIQRLQAGRCEMCQHTGEVVVYHVGKLAHLGRPGQPQPPWRNSWRKGDERPSWSAPPATTPSMTGNQPRTQHGVITGELDDRKRSCPVRRGSSGKGPTHGWHLARRPTSRRLRHHGLVQRIEGSHRYTVTENGLHLALFLTRAHNRLLRSGLSDILDHAAMPTPIQRHLHRLTTALDDYAREQKLAA